MIILEYTGIDNAEILWNTITYYNLIVRYKHISTTTNRHGVFKIIYHLDIRKKGTLNQSYNKEEIEDLISNYYAKTQ